MNLLLKTSLVFIFLCSCKSIQEGDMNSLKSHDNDPAIEFLMHNGTIKLEKSKYYVNILICKETKFCFRYHSNCQKIENDKYCELNDEYVDFISEKLNEIESAMSDEHYVDNVLMVELKNRWGLDTIDPQLSAWENLVKQSHHNKLRIAKEYGVNLEKRKELIWKTSHNANSKGYVDSIPTLSANALGILGYTGLNSEYYYNKSILQSDGNVFATIEAFYEVDSDIDSCLDQGSYFIANRYGEPKVSTFPLSGPNEWVSPYNMKPQDLVDFLQDFYPGFVEDYEKKLCQELEMSHQDVHEGERIQLECKQGKKRNKYILKKKDYFVPLMRKLRLWDFTIADYIHLVESMAAQSKASDFFQRLRGKIDCVKINGKNYRRFLPKFKGNGLKAEYKYVFAFDQRNR